MDQPRICANLDKIEALVDWLRHTKDLTVKPPERMIYDAAGAVANLRHALCGGPDPVTGKIVPSRPASQTEPQ